MIVQLRSGFDTGRDGNERERGVHLAHGSIPRAKNDPCLRALRQ